MPLLAALLRSDLRFFVRKSFQTILPGTPYLPNWHIDAIVHQLMRVQAGDISRLLINQPPRSLKSITVSVAYVAWLLGHDPSRRVIVVSYANELAAELHRQFRMIIDAPWYRALFPAMRPARDSGSEFVTTAGGGRYATSVGGTLTGRGADLIIIDDPLKAEEAMSEVARKRAIDWYARHTGVTPQRQGAWSRLWWSCSACMKAILPATCLIRVAGSTSTCRPLPWTTASSHLGSGKVMTRRAGDVLHPERESKEALDRTKSEIGSLMFSAQYQQRPIPLEGNLIRRDWFRFYDVLPDQPHKRIVQSWDIATMTGDTNDYSVCTTWLMIKDGLLSGRRIPRPPRISCPSTESCQSRGRARRRHRPDRECGSRHGSFCRTSGTTCRRACHARLVESRKAAKRIAWWLSQPRLRQDTSTCLATPTGLTPSC